MGKKKHFDVNKIERICPLCGKVFYAKRQTAIYCSDTCKQTAYQLRKENRNGYEGDLNKNVKLPPGTITSQGSPESDFIFSGTLDELKQFLLENYLMEEDLEFEMKYVQKLKPICITQLWEDSSCQLHLNSHVIEVMFIHPGCYKLYAHVW